MRFVFSVGILVALICQPGFSGEPHYLLDLAPQGQLVVKNPIPLHLSFVTEHHQANLFFQAGAPVARDGVKQDLPYCRIIFRILAKLSKKLPPRKMQTFIPEETHYPMGDRLYVEDRLIERIECRRGFATSAEESFYGHQPLADDLRNAFGEYLSAEMN